MDLWTALQVTTGQHFQATPGKGLTAGIRETGTRDQVLRLQAFRVAHPEVIIGDFGFGVWQARTPSRTASTSSAGTRSANWLDKLDDLTGEHRSQPNSGQD